MKYGTFIVLELCPTLLCRKHVFCGFCVFSSSFPYTTVRFTWHRESKEVENVKFTTGMYTYQQTDAGHFSTRKTQMIIWLWRVENHTTNRWTINYLFNIYMEILYLVPFRHIFSVPRSLVRSVAYGKSEVKLFACKEITNRWSFSFSKGEKWFDKLFNLKYLHLFHHFKAIYQFPKHIIFWSKS
jgi:hypothetical protein